MTRLAKATAAAAAASAIPVSGDRQPSAAAAVLPDAPRLRRAGTPRRLRRRFRSPSVPSGGGSRKCGPATPSLRWGEENEVERVSVRRLAAALWQLRPAAASGLGFRDAAALRVGVENIPRHLQIQLLKHNAVGYHHTPKNEIASPISVLDLKNPDFHTVQFDAPSTTFPVSMMEKATNWEPGNANLVGNHLSLDSYKGATFSSNLQLELQEAREKISELESERRSAKKKMDQFLKKLSEDKAAWRAREHEKVRTVIDDMKAELDREKKNRRRLEMLNAKLISEIKDTRKSTMQTLQDLEKERKARELIEEVCNELAKEVEEDKAEMETLKQESMRLKDEVDEERKMLQMAEVWREERVQMKLVDAKLTLDSKYQQLNKLQQDIDAFLKTQKSGEGGSTAVNKAEALMNVIDAARAHEIEFSYDPPPPSEDIMAVFEELCPKQEPAIKEIEACYRSSPAVEESDVHETSPATDIFLQDLGKVHSKISGDDETETEDGSSWETISPEDMLRSSISFEGSEASVNKNSDGNNSCAGGNDLDEARKPNIDLNGTNPASMKQQKKSAIARLWKSSRHKNSEVCKKDTVEVAGRRLSLARSSIGSEVCSGRESNVRHSIGSYSPEAGLQETGLSPQSIEHWSSPDSLGTQFPRGLRGCIECPPRSTHKHSLKAKLMEVRTESQKLQLRHVLKQKM